MVNIVTQRNRNQPAPMVQRFAEWDPFERMREFMQWDLLQDLPRRWLLDDTPPAFVPRFDVREEKDCFTIRADMPGLRENDVEISVSGNRLTISGKREEEKSRGDKEGQTYYCRERSFGAFTRTFTLPDNVDPDKIRANMQDGVLELAIPKSTESQPRKIPLTTKSGGGTSQAPGGAKAG